MNAVTQAVDSGTIAMDMLQQTMDSIPDTSGIERAGEAFTRLSQTADNTGRHIRDNIGEQRSFNREIEQGTQKAGGLTGAIKGAVAAYASLQTAKKVIDLSDQMTQTTARLNLIVDDGGSVEGLEDKIFNSAQRSRGAYQATADAVSKLGLMAGNAFDNNDEIIAFSEQLNKHFVIAGTNAAGIDAAMLQLTQAMGSGVLRGEEYNSILEQAPNIIQDIAKYIEENEDLTASMAAKMGIGYDELAGNVQGKMKDIASEGLISAEMVKNAMLSAAEETNKAFDSMPMTFKDIWTSFSNEALRAFQPALEKLNEFANTEHFQTFVSNAASALGVVAEIAVDLLETIGNVGGFIADNWSIVEPIIMGVVTALGLYYGAMLLYNTVTGIASAITAAKAFADKVHAASLAMQTGATFAATAAQYGFNAALLACPITWIIIAIIAVIAVIYAVVAAINKLTGTSVSATGIICGAFMTALAFIGNIFVALWNLIVDVFVLIYNLVAEVANFIGNVFTDPIGAVCRLFFGLADTVLGILQALASAIDAIFGSNLSGTVQGWRDGLSGWVDETFGKGNEIMAKMNADDLKLGRFEYGAAWDMGYSFGEGLFGGDEDNDDDGGDGIRADDDPNDWGKEMAAQTQTLEDIGGGVNDIADGMDISEEELKYLRDIAEQETVNRFTTASITVEQTNHNNISSKMDLDGVVDGLTDAVNEAVLIITEGVHA